MTPGVFWSLTLREFILAMRGYSKEQERLGKQGIVFSWHVAAFTRAKDLPRIDALFKEKPSLERIREANRKQQELHKQRMKLKEQQNGV